MEKKNWVQMVKFTAFSISAGVIQVLSFIILNEVFVVFRGEYGVNYVISLLASIVWNFTFNRKYTFQASRNVYHSMGLILAFYAVFTPLSALLGSHVESQGVSPYLVLAVTMIANFILEFVYTKYIVYPDKKQSRH